MIAYGSCNMLLCGLVDGVHSALHASANSFHMQLPLLHMTSTLVPALKLFMHKISYWFQSS
jgi:hypothetical protein